MNAIDELKEALKEARGADFHGLPDPLIDIIVGRYAHRLVDADELRERLGNQKRSVFPNVTESFRTYTHGVNHGLLLARKVIDALTAKPESEGE